VEKIYRRQKLNENWRDKHHQMRKLVFI